MALPHNQWLEIISGPGTWKLITTLFREIDEPSNYCTFTVVEPGNRREKHTFKVLVRDVHRLPGGTGKFMARGSIEELADREWESLPGRFMVHYNPETREGYFKIEGCTET